MAQTPHMALELLEQSQAQKEVTVNEALFRLDALLNSGALDRGLNTPPSSPAEGDVYIIGATPTGDWAGKAGQLAYFHQIWRFIEPNAGLMIWVIDEAAHYVYDGSDWGLVASGGGSSDVPLSFRNLLINGDFAVNQRVATSVASDTYHLDRWYALTSSGNVTIAQLADAESGQTTSLRMEQPDASPKRIGSAQILEGRQCKHARGQSVTFSGRYRCSASQNIHMAVLEWTGTEDSVTSAVVNNWSSGTYTPGNFFIGTSVNVVAIGSYTPPANSWQDFEITGTVGGSANNLIVLCWSTGTLAQNATLDMGLAQLEVGSSKTVFERRPVGLELTFCQRYFFHKNFASNQIVGMGQAYSNNSVFGAMFTLPIPMRLSSGATIGYSSITHFTFSTPTGPTQTVATMSLSLVADSLVIVNSTSTGTGLTAGSASVVRSNNNSGYINASAEL